MVSASDDRSQPQRRRERPYRLAFPRLAILIVAFVFVIAMATGATSPRAASSDNGEVRARATPDRASLHRSASPMAGRDMSVHDMSSHEDSEGLKLVASDAETVANDGHGCSSAARVREYDIAAIDVDITLNRYLDHDPQGRMYVLEHDVARVRREEAANAAARTSGAEPAAALGLQGDAIQPLTLRVRPGECLRVRLRNALRDGMPASLHLHGSSLVVAPRHSPATAENRDAVAGPGRRLTYEWALPHDEREGTHYFHSHAEERVETNHGLFGAVIVEPPGSRWLNPRTGRAFRTGWDAIVVDPRGPAFREFVLYYHEIGDETYQLRDRHDQFVPLVDPITHAYRPNGRALNYRSEPFMNRLALQQERTGVTDKSLAYSSYAFGDPATPMMRSYLGDPVKQRVVHGGGEVFHVHHVHGGSIRWRRQPGEEPTGFARGLDKNPPLVPVASERTDSQSIGPSETFDTPAECGSGGCQQSVGDFLYHCHIAHHYFAGMWGLWRVYNTLQDGLASTDTLAPLRELPDRAGRVAPAIESGSLIDRTADSYGTRTAITRSNLHSWVEQQLPARGIPRGYDASVFDWAVDGDRYLDQPETTQTWPAYRARAPATRPALRFDPHTGKLAYPALRPHLGQRPPFPPDHNPAPFLEPEHDQNGLAPPGANGRASLCPSGTHDRNLAINAIRQPVTLNARDNIVDPGGELFVLRSQQDAARQDPALQVPLAVRANAGEDCVDVVLRSELADNADTPFSKVGLHIHFVQFDVQASDGVSAGFNYEQSIRPFRAAGETLRESVASGTARLRTTNTSQFQPGVVIGVGMDRDRTFEVARVAAVSDGTVTLDRPLVFAHDEGEWVSTEFARYRWYPDSQFGTAYFHDHVDALNSWQHGLFGALIAEPPGSTYLDPHSGAPLESGAAADIHTDAQVGADVRGSFRELALFVQDGHAVTRVARSSGGSLNLRVEPLDSRGNDPTRLFSSARFGDPETPIVDAYLDDPVVIRALVGGTNDVHTVHVDGHWFRAEPWSKTSPPISTIQLGISERYDLVIPRAGGPQKIAGDYLYYNGRAFKLREGNWGLVRVHDTPMPGLRPLSDGARVPTSTSRVCPTGAPRRTFAVSAIDIALPMLRGARGKAYVLNADRTAALAGNKRVEPLVLHAAVGDCIQIALTNATKEGRVSLHADMLAYDPSRSSGIAAGNEPVQAVKPGAHRTFTFYATREVGETTALLRDGADPLHNPRLGLYGAIVVGPRGATYTGHGWNVVGRAPGRRPWRDFALFFQDEDETIGTHRMPYTKTVEGVVGLNYTVAPPPGTLPTQAPTPLLSAYPGDPITLHVLSPWSEQPQVFSIEGHSWKIEPKRYGTNIVNSTAFGAMQAVTIQPLGGAGGPQHLPGDYEYGDHREPYREAGLWGTLHVAECGHHEPGLETLPQSSCDAASQWNAPRITLLAIASVLTAGLLLRIRRRHARNR